MLQSQKNKATISILGKLRQQGTPGSKPGSIQGASMIPTPLGEDAFQDPEDQALEGESDIESGDDTGGNPDSSNQETLNDMKVAGLRKKKPSRF